VDVEGLVEDDGELTDMQQLAHETMRRN